jgi:hypothetical protein
LLLFAITKEKTAPKPMAFKSEIPDSKLKKSNGLRSWIGLIRFVNQK